MAVGSFLFVGAGIGMLASPRSAKDVIFGVAGIAFFGYGLLVFVRAIVHPRPLLVVSGAGLTINGWRTATPGRFYAWESIASMRSFRIRVTPFLRGQLVVGLVPVDAADPAFNSPKQRVDRALSHVAVSFPMSLVPISLVELEQVVHTYRPDLQFAAGKPVRLYGVTLAGVALGR